MPSPFQESDHAQMSMHPQPPTQVDGPRIQLKARSRDHAEEMFAMIDRNRQHLRPWMPWESVTLKVEDSAAYLDMTISWREKRSTFDYSIFESSTFKMIGSFGIHSINWDRKTCELGYWIDKASEGNGFITEAVQLGEKLAGDLGFHRVIITCDRENQRSQKVPKSLGYKLESLTIDDCLVNGKLRDTMTFVKLINKPIEGQITENLPEGFSIKHCEADEFWKEVDQQIHRVFDDNELILRTRDIISEKEKALLKALPFDRPFFRYSLLLHREQLAGWTWGYQDSPESYYMVNSAILPQYRGRGLYSTLLEVTMRMLVDKGFQRIWSRHNMTNNAVIIPKLKRGFMITGTELSEVFGALVHLTYHTNQTRKKALEFRAGTLRPDAELKKIFRI